MLRVFIVAVALVTTAALAQPQPPQPPRPPPPPGRGLPPGMGMGRGPGMGMGPMMLHGQPGIPPQLAAKLGISQDTLKKVRDLTFDANEQLITLQAEVQKKQLALHRALSEDRVDEKVAMARLDEVSRAELAVKKNRLSLMLRIRALLGPDTWQKLQAEMPPFGPEAMGWGGGQHVQKRVRIIRGAGGQDVEIDEGP